MTSYTGTVRQLLFCFGHVELLDGEPHREGTSSLFTGAGELYEAVCGSRGSCV